MKRYLLFCYDGYYPEGGWNDYHSTDDDIETLKAKITSMVFPSRPPNFADIVDTETMKIVARFGSLSGWQ